MKVLDSSMFIALSVGFITAILSTGCITKDTALDAVDVEPTPGFIALQNQRYTVAKGISCYRGPEPILPNVSVHIANDWITIALSYGNRWGPSPEEVEAHVWNIPNADGYDWSATKKALLEVRELLSKKETKDQARVSIQDETMTPSLKRSADEFSPFESARKAGVFGIMATATFHEIEIAAEDEVRYGDILNAVDLAVETDFVDFAFVEPEDLSWAQE